MLLFLLGGGKKWAIATSFHSVYKNKKKSKFYEQFKFSAEILKNKYEYIRWEWEKWQKRGTYIYSGGFSLFFFLHVFTLILKAKGLRGSDIPKTIPPGESDDVNIES